MSTITRTWHVLAVRDLAVSEAWYRGVLGFEPTGIEAPGWAFLQRGGCQLMLGECPDERPAGEQGNHSLFAYLVVDDAQALHDELAGRGAEIIHPLQDKPWGMREFGVRTPDGHRINIGQDLD